MTASSAPSTLAALRLDFALAFDEPIEPWGFFGATLRGGLGFTLKRFVCVRRDGQCPSCPLRVTCLYRRLFEPTAESLPPLFTGMRDLPRPFILDTSAVRAGTTTRRVEFGLTLVGDAAAQFHYFIQAFAELGARGVSRDRRPYTLESVRSGDAVIYSSADRVIGRPPRAPAVPLDGLMALAEHEIEVLFVDGIGRPFGSFIGTGHLRSARLRRLQYEAALGPKGGYLARVFAATKVANQARLLSYFTRNEPCEGVEEVIGRIKAILESIDAIESDSADAARWRIMGLEGSAARLYWGGVMRLLDGRADFQGREGRGAEDAVNSCLNYGYAILYGEIWRAAERVGLARRVPEGREER